MTDNLRGIIAMLVSTASFTFGDALIKLLGRDLPVGQIMFLRGLFATAVIVAIAHASGAFARPKLAATPRMALRTLAEMACTTTYFIGLLQIPFADAAAIGQVTPLAVTAGAAVFLGERVGWRRWSATAVGFLGVLLVIRPGTSAFDWGALWLAVSVLLVALRDLVTRGFPADTPSLLITSVTAAAITVTGLALAPFESWQAPGATHVLLLAAAALTVLNGYYWGIVAMRFGEVSVVQPFRYTAIVFAIAIGIVVFGETVDMLAIVGNAVVVGAGLYTLHRERLLGRVKQTAVPVGPAAAVLERHTP